MATKKLLTYEGLEEYNIKWHERLQELSITDIEIKDTFINAMMENYTWSYEFDTTFGFPYYGESYRLYDHIWYYSSLNYEFNLASIPFSLHYSQNASMTVDWGDGTVETLTSADYQSRVICPSSIHEYANPGTYTISVTSSNWNQIYISGGCVSIGFYGAGSMPWRAVYDDRVTQEKHNEPDYYRAAHPDLQGDYRDTIQNMMSLMRFGLKKILNPLPKLAGTLVSENYNNLSDEPDVDPGVDEGTYTGIPEFVGIPMYGTKLPNKLYFVFDDSHLIGNKYPSNLFEYNYSLDILGAFGELDENNGVKSPHITVIDSEDETTEIWSDLPIQSNAIDTGETIYLAFGNNFKYEPSSNGIKCISIINSKSAVNSQSFKLEIINGGEFSIQWASNIKWKNGVAPQFVSYHTDVLMFHTSNNGRTWVGEVIQSTEMTPYWKFIVVPFNSNSYDSDWQYVPISIIAPINKEAIEYIDWGDGTIETNSFSSLESDTFPKHLYTGTVKTYSITIKSTKFDTGYISINSTLTSNLLEIVNPLPHLKGSYQNISDSLTAVDNTFNNLFRGCSRLRAVPDRLFEHNSYPIGANCFRSCSQLENIPQNAFDNDLDILSFDYAFYMCEKLKSIPEGLFDQHTSATTFNYCFYYCTSLQSIPSNLFDNNTAATSFTSCFYNCTSLQSIPEGLFDNNTAITNFNYCFCGCTSLTSIPSGLFDNNTAVTSFNDCFSSCYSLHSIPEGLFDNNTAVTSFDSCFYSSRSLQMIPEMLFATNLNAENFDFCFYDCTTINGFTLHIGSNAVSSCSNFVSKNDTYVRTIYVPLNSTTQTTFNGVASSLSLTIVGE